MPPSEMLPHQLMQRLAEFFETNGIRYHVVGSMASMAHGEPRFTNDVDIVARLPPSMVSTMSEHFPPPDYYLSADAAYDAIRRRSQFNILHLPSGFKADIIIPNDSDFELSSADRARRITSEGEFSAIFGSPEDTILNKLLFFKKSGGASMKHIRDISGIMKVQRGQLDSGYVDRWAAHLGILDEWKLISEKTGHDASPSQI